jgi:hypothetical protein
MITFIEWLKRQENLNEINTRYSVEVNFRTRIKEILESYAKITLGYVSAALKNANYHVKQVFDDGLIRIMVSMRNWDDGTWVVVASWNPHHNCFIITTGFYNRMNKSISVKKEEGQKCSAENASEITNQIKNILHHLKDKKDKHIEKLKKVPLKTGPK